jgi:hypothetical protein
MPRSSVRRTSLALAALFALQLGAALASAAPCAVACCPGMPATGDADAAPCRSLSPVSCCSESTATPPLEASAPPVAAPAALTCLPAPAVSTASAAARLDGRVGPAPALCSVVLRL